MPYVQRDSKGHITAVSPTQNDLCTQPIEADNPEYLNYLELLQQNDFSEQKLEFIRADLDFIRVMEDLIDTLIKKNVIRLTDLPPAVQTKLVRRRKIRAELTQNQFMLDDDSPLI